jgi:heme/copper-type cytochrome/quinol oxidase subunit 1
MSVSGPWFCFFLSRILANRDLKNFSLCSMAILSILIFNIILWMHIMTHTCMEPQTKYFETCSSWVQQGRGVTFESLRSIFMYTGSTIYQQKRGYTSFCEFLILFDNGGSLKTKMSGYILISIIKKHPFG